MTNFQVARITPVAEKINADGSKTFPGFLIKLQSEQSGKTIAGLGTQSGQKTYYVKLSELAAGVQVGTVVPLDEDNLTITKRAFKAEDGTDMMLDYIKL